MSSVRRPSLQVRSVLFTPALSPVSGKHHRTRLSRAHVPGYRPACCKLSSTRLYESFGHAGSSLCGCQAWAEAARLIVHSMQKIGSLVLPPCIAMQMTCNLQPPHPIHGTKAALCVTWHWRWPVCVAPIAVSRSELYHQAMLGVKLPRSSPLTTTPRSVSSLLRMTERCCAGAWRQPAGGVMAAKPLVMDFETILCHISGTTLKHTFRSCAAGGSIGACRQLRGGCATAEPAAHAGIRGTGNTPPALRHRLEQPRFVSHVVSEGNNVGENRLAAVRCVI